MQAKFESLSRHANSLRDRLPKDDKVERNKNKKNQKQKQKQKQKKKKKIDQLPHRKSMERVGISED